MKVVKFFLWFQVIILGLVVTFALVGYISSEIKPSGNGIRMPFSSAEVIDERVSTVKMVLEDVGFTNISLKPATDGLPWDKGTVYRIQVGDSTSFSIGDTFPPDVRVIISYKKAGMGG